MEAREVNLADSAVIPLRVLKKTCRKHGIRFWDYLMDRLTGNNAILPLADYIRRAAECKA